MVSEMDGEKQVPTGVLTGISFTVLTETDAEKLSVVSIEHPNEVTDAKLGFPNPISQCSTCGAKDSKHCEGHFGVIKFGRTILHPYFTSEVVQILNKICPACKSIRKNLKVKGTSMANLGILKICKHCSGRYPPMRFRVSSTDEFRKSAIIVEVVEKLPKKFQGRSLPLFLPDDYWDFIPNDFEQEESLNRTDRKVLTHAQIHYLLKDVSPKLVKEFVSKTDALFLNCFPVTPNCHRVTEFVHPLSNGQKLVFDDRTRAFRKLAGYKGRANELASHVLDSLNLSKLHLEKPSNGSNFMTNKDANLNTTCSKWLREVVLAKRSNHIFRMVVTGDPNLMLGEIGIPCYIAERLQIADSLNSWNRDKLTATFNLSLLEKGEVFVRRKGELVRIKDVDHLQMGDTINRPLCDGDILLINRPPTIHQHSLLALAVKVLPISFVVSINPLCCAPLSGDFDGDCLHGYIPQSVDCRVELKELVGLDKQLTNGQSGRNLLSLSHDSLVALHLLMTEGDLLGKIQLQQLAMLCPQSPKPPVIVKGRSGHSLWNGTQLFSMLLPPDFEYVCNDVLVKNGELISCPAGSFWLQGDVDGNFFESLIRHSSGKFLDYLHAAQQVLCEWLSIRGLSISLSDLYLSSDTQYHDNMIEEVRCGLQEAERMCHVKQMMVESYVRYLSDITEESHDAMLLEVEELCFKNQRSAALSQASVGAFKYIFRDIQNLTYQYASRDNSLLAIIKSGSKGSLLKVVQQSMCLGLQHSLVPLSFRLPYELSCSAWNNLKTSSSGSAGQDDYGCADSYIPYAVVENSFLAGLNPLECFVHSVTCRGSSFSENAEVPGTLNKRLMFFMRDLYTAYDGTVRNAYGNQLIQFSYSGTVDRPSPDHRACDSFDPSFYSEPVAGEPVGSLASCAISEVAYSALDQPVSVLEASPLLNLKKVLESGSRKSNTSKTVSLFLSTKLGKVRHGFEYAALEVKNHLEKLLFSDLVSTVMIFYSPQTIREMHTSPWVCHFHVCKETLRRRRLKMHSIIDALSSGFYKLQIKCQTCGLADTEKQGQDTLCITVTIIESSRNSYTALDTVRDVLIPNLLSCVVKGFLEIERVDILWNDQPTELGSQKHSFGELYLRVSCSPKIRKAKLWSKMMDNCLPIMGLIDWTRSHPDDLCDMFSSYGIGAAWRYFLRNLKSAVHDIGKTVLPGHMILLADCLSATGEFMGLTAKGMTRQKAQMSVSAPFMQACFSNPARAFTKAAKFEASDQLQGSLETLAWGKIPSVGTGAQFEFIYSRKGHELHKPVDVYSQLHSLTSYHERNVKMEVPTGFKFLPKDIDAQYPRILAAKGFKNLGTLTKSLLQSRVTLNDVQQLSHRLKYILNKYSIDQRLSDLDKTAILMALHFHPRRKEKLGTGAVDIKVGRHPDHQDTRCFVLERKDGTVVDFSYHKCVVGALEIIAPHRAKNYHSKWLKSSTTNA